MPDPDYSNCPSCPEIKKKIDRIDRALLGEDGTGMNGGIVHAITSLQKNHKVQSSWINTFKPILLSVASGLLYSAITYIIVTHAY
jgi:hypothetical protein